MSKDSTRKTSNTCNTQTYILLCDGIPHSDKVPVPIFTKLPDTDEDQLRSSTSSTNSDDDDEEQDIAHEAWNAGRVSL